MLFLSLTFESLRHIDWSQQWVVFQESGHRCWSPPGGSFRSPGMNTGCIPGLYFPVSGILLRSCVRFFFLQILVPTRFPPGLRRCSSNRKLFPPKSRGNVLARVHLFWVSRESNAILRGSGAAKPRAQQESLKKGGVTDVDSVGQAPRRAGFSSCLLCAATVTASTHLPLLFRLLL